MVYVLSKKLEIVLNPLNILIRCDASIDIGLGHVTRCLALAKQFKESGHHVFFAIKDYDLGIKSIKEQGFAVNIAPTNFNYTKWLLILAKELSINIFIGDVRDDLPIKAIIQLKKKNILTVAIDEPSDYRRACDLCFYPPHAQLEKLDWNGFTGQIKQGFEYVLLRPEFHSDHLNLNKKQQNILIMMGGTDPSNLTIPVVQHIINLKPTSVISVIINKDNNDYITLKSMGKNVHVYSQIENMAEFLLNITYGVISFGTSAYELLSLGISATHICLNNDHWEANLFFRKNEFAQGIMIDSFNVQSLNIPDEPQQTKIIESFKKKAILEKIKHEYQNRIYEKILKNQ